MQIHVDMFEGCSNLLNIFIYVEVNISFWDGVKNHTQHSFQCNERKRHIMYVYLAILVQGQSGEIFKP